MKKLLLLIIAVTAANIFAAIPQSITLESGNILVRLDGRKRWNMNRIEWKKQLLCVDNAHSHYGMTCRPHNFKFGVGSGHDESGFVEEAKSVKIYADGKEITPEEGKIIKSDKIKVEKISSILDLNVKYIIEIANDIIHEKIEVISAKKMRTHHLYFFMHPWSPRFDKFHTVYPDGKKFDTDFKSKNAFPSRKFASHAAWYDTKSGIGVVTFFKNVEGANKMMRFIWDRPQYRKDYLCDYFHATLDANKKLAYEAKTVFFQQKDSAKWISDAENIFTKLK